MGQHVGARVHLARAAALHEIGVQQCLEPRGAASRRRLLEFHGGIEVVAEAADADAAYVAWRRHRPQLTIIDLIWGTSLTMLSATGGYFAARWAEGRFG